MWSPYMIFVAVLMVTTGTINTLSMKWADHIEAVGTDGKTRPFDHPVLQTTFMFLGEMSCLLAFHILVWYFRRRQQSGEGAEIEQHELISGNHVFNIFYFLPPSILDLVATSTMYIGLNLTYASSFQMLRGSVIVFTEIFSMIFLSRKFALPKWLGIVLIICGLGMVGISDFIYTDDASKDRTNIVTGDILIILAQVVTALQMVYEEKFCLALDAPPIKAVGCEGLFGFTLVVLLLIPFNFIRVPEPYQNNPNGTIEDLAQAFEQIKNKMLLLVPLLGNTFSIAFFNFAGVCIAKNKSATTRMILDTLRTFFIWIVSILLQWQKFHALQVYGFIVILLGMTTYNGVWSSLIPALRNRQSEEENNDREGLVNRAANEI